MPETSPQPNEPAARTTDGTLLDQGATQTTPAQTSSTQTSTSAEATPNEPTTAPAATPPKTPDGPPAAYVFKAPEGGTFDQATIDKASAVFKELGLTQAQADKLIELQSGLAQSSADQALKVIRDMDAKFEAQLKADPEMGPNLDKIRTTIGQAFNTVLKPTERDAFSKAMFATGLGNHPDISRVIYKLAERIAPGTHVAGDGPSTHGQTADGTTQRPSVAQAMWPNLKAS